MPRGSLGQGTAVWGARLCAVENFSQGIFALSMKYCRQFGRINVS